MELEELRARFREAECMSEHQAALRDALMETLDSAQRMMHDFEDAHAALDVRTLKRVGDLIGEAEEAVADLADGVRLFSELLIDGAHPERDAISIGWQLKALSERHRELPQLRAAARVLALPGLRRQLEAFEAGRRDAAAPGAAGGADA